MKNMFYCLILTSNTVKNNTKLGINSCKNMNIFAIKKQANKKVQVTFVYTAINVICYLSIKAPIFWNGGEKECNKIYRKPHFRIIRSNRINLNSLGFFCVSPSSFL